MRGPGSRYFGVRRRGPWLAALSGVLAAVASFGQEPPPAAPAATFRGGVELLRLRVTVRDPAGRLVPTLDQQDFRVLVDGREVPIEVFSNDPQPVTVVMLLSTAAEESAAPRTRTPRAPSVTELPLPRLRAAAEALVIALAPDDTAMVGSFANEIAITPDATSDRERLLDVLREEIWPGWGNPLGTALDRAIKALGGHRGKRAILVLGIDRRELCLRAQPCTPLSDVRTNLLSHDILVYGVQTKTPSRNGPAGPVWRLAIDTGGGYERLEEGADVAAAMVATLDAIRREYVLGVSITGEPRLAKGVEIRLSDPRLKPQVRGVNRASSR